MDYTALMAWLMCLEMYHDDWTMFSGEEVIFNNSGCKVGMIKLVYN